MGVAMVTLRASRFVALLSIVSAVGGCATLGPRTEGVSGPIAWQVADLAVSTREINGRPVDGRAFTLVIKNVSAETVTFTQFDETRYQPGTAPGSTSRAGRWILAPGQEWRVPRFYSLVCSFDRCTDTTLAQPMFRIRLRGEKQQGGTVDATLDITLPAQGMGRPPVMR